MCIRDRFAFIRFIEQEFDLRVIDRFAAVVDQQVLLGDVSLSLIHI